MAHDPTPGDPVAVRAGGTRYVAIADAIGRAAATMRTLEAGVSNVDSVKALMESRDKVVDSVGVAEGRYRAAGNALTAYATVLDRVQADTLHALRAAHNAAGDAADAADDRAKFHRRAQDAKDAGDAEEQSKWEKKEDAAERAGSQAAGAVAAQKRVVERAVDDRDAAARTAIEAITASTSNDGLNDSWWNDWGAKLTEWVAKVAEAIASIAGLLALAFCWVPVLGPALLLIAAVAGIVAAIANIILAAGGEQSWGEAIKSVVFAALGSIGLGAFGLFGGPLAGIWAPLNGLGVDGLKWMRDRLIEGANWLRTTFTNSVVSGWTAATRVADAEWKFWSHTAFELWQWRLPQTAEIKAHMALTVGLLAGTVANFMTGTDQHIFAQGTGQVGKPIKAPQSSPPDGISGIVSDMMASYESGGVQVKAIHDGNGHTTYIASIPGTDAPLFGAEGWAGAQNGRDWPANLWSISTGSSAYTEAVKQAIDAAIARDRAANPTASDAPPSIILAGHSQGGIIAANLASDPQFAAKHNIRGIVTAGAPVECAEIPADVKVLSIQHGDTELASHFGPLQYLMGGDIVPSLDDGGRNILGIKEYHSNISTVVTLPPGIDPYTNHVQAGYGLPPGFTTPQISTFEQSVGASDVYAGSGKTSDTYTVPIGVTFP